jgi:SpoVK/Ycf46/Vps4 family AAA+-type ATPase
VTARRSDDTDEIAHTSLVWVGPVRTDVPELEVEMTRLRMPLPDREVVRRTCERVFPGGEFPEIDPDIMVTGALGLTRRQADRAYRRVRRQLEEARSRNAVLDVEQAVLREKQRMIGESELLEFHPLEVGLGDVGGMSALKSWLDERQRAFDEEARAYGLPMPKGMLLLGVQGCGKSLTAKAVARYWHMPLLRLDLGAVFDGRRSPEEAMRTAIEKAEAVSPCVLWMDEIEKGFMGDGEGRSQRVLGSLLTWQQEKDEPVFLVATANDVEKLPPELLRKGRFDEIFFIDLPERHEREEILEIHLQRRGRDMPDGVVEEIATDAEYFSGAELEQVVVGAMYAAFADDREPDADDLRYAAEEIVPLYRTYEEQIKALREWAHSRARPASHERQMIDYFE